MSTNAFVRVLDTAAKDTLECVAILQLLMQRETCICGEIVDELPLAQSTVSQHLKKLKAAGLIRGDVDGPKVCYCVEPAAVAHFHALVDALTSTDLSSPETPQ